MVILSQFFWCWAYLSTVRGEKTYYQYYFVFKLNKNIKIDVG